MEEDGTGTPLINGRRGQRSKAWKVAASTGLVVVILVLVIACTAVLSSTPGEAATSKQTKQVSAEVAVQRRSSFLSRAHNILSQVPLIDGHNDMPYALQLRTDGQLSKFNLDGNLTKQLDRKFETDIPLMRAGQMGGQFWAVFITCATQYKDAVEKAFQLIDLIKRFTKQYGDFFQSATSSQDIITAHQNSKVASLIGVEGGHMMANSLGVLRTFYDTGVRYMTLTWNCNTAWADYNRPEMDKVTAMKGGLSSWGELVVKEMNRLGMMVDISHVSPNTMRDVIRVSRAPVIFSHSSVYSLCPHPRNVPDEVLDLMRDNDGIVMLNFYNKFINCTEENRFEHGPRTASMAQIVEHLEYLKQKVGPDRIGLGSDFNGVNGWIYTVDVSQHFATGSNFPVGLEDSSKYPYLIAALLQRGWSDNDVKKLIGLNIIRVMRRVEKVRDESVDMLPYETPLPISEIPVRTCKVLPWNA